MPSKLGKSFDRAASWARKTLPTKKPFKVRSTPDKLTLNGKECCAVLEDCGKYWRILVYRKLTQEESIDSLWHELAHIFQFERNPEAVKEHSQLWGIEYARIYDKYTKWRDSVVDRA